MSQSRLVSDVDWILRRAAKTPGPGSYEIEKKNLRNGGRFSTAHPKSDVDWRIYMASRQPGPADYTPDSIYSISGGRLSHSRPKSQLDDMLRKAAMSPGPGEYDGDVTAISKRVGRVPFLPREPTATPQPRNKTIPPEARGKPRPKPSATPQPEVSKEQGEETPSRPHTSQGLPSIQQNRNEPGGAKSEEKKKKATKLKTRGLRQPSMPPSKLIIPDGAARAYGLIGDGGHRAL